MPGPATCLTCIAPLTTASEPSRKASARAESGTERGKHGDGAEPAADRHGRGEQLLPDGDAGPAVEEGVVERMDDRHGHGAAEHERLARPRPGDGAR